MFLHNSFDCNCTPSYLMIHPEPLQLWQVPGSTHLVEDMVIPLLGDLEDYPGLLEEVGPHAGANDVETLVKVNLNVFAETTRVIVTGCLGVS